jgi:hypothetical protein
MNILVFQLFFAPALKGEKLKNQHVTFRDLVQKHVDFLICQNRIRFIANFIDAGIFYAA